MSTPTRVRQAPKTRPSLPEPLDRRFEAAIFDWDGTAVPDRSVDARELRALIEELCGRGFDLVVITGTHVGNVDGQLGARPSGPGRLYFCVNRGSEVYAANETGLELVHRREATHDEDVALDRAAEATVGELGRRGLAAAVVSQRLNRRKIDLIPEPEWADPPKAQIAALLQAVQDRLQAAGLAGLTAAVDVALRAAADAGIDDPRVTSDAKHIEIGLTDKGDSARWAFAELARRGVSPGMTIVAGDEFGPLGGLAGSDSFLLVPEGAAATAFSVGAEPSGIPGGVLSLHGGPEVFAAVLADQLERRRRGDVPELEMDPEWTLIVEGVDPMQERVHESLLTIADGRLGTRGSPLFKDPSSAPAVLLSGAYTGEGAATQLAVAPSWMEVFPVRPKHAVMRALDLFTGLLREAGAYESVRFPSLARPGTVALRLKGKGARGRRPNRTRAPVTAFFSNRRHGPIFERLAAYDTDEGVARARLAEAEGAGFEALLKEQRMAWASRWHAADAIIEGDAELQLAVRFALFHLMASVADRGEAAVGARGLTGRAYSGHVFWDSDVFVLPFLAATHPEAARAMLEYRIRRLTAAREAARALGGRGRVSHGSRPQTDTTSPRRPCAAHTASSSPSVPERSRSTSWATSRGRRLLRGLDRDTAFAEGPGRDLLVETARYWASRIRIRATERRTSTASSARTNTTSPSTTTPSRTCLRAGTCVEPRPCRRDATSERDRWLAIADALVDGYDPASGIYEQFAGFRISSPS